MFNRVQAIAAAAVIAAGVAGSAQADQFASYTPVSGSTPNISLTSGVLSANAPVTFNYDMPGTLAALGDLAATLNLSATQQDAAMFGKLVDGDFAGNFQINYTGPTKTVGGVTVTTGELLLSGEFTGDGDTFAGKGSTATMQYSLAAGDTVNFDNNALISFIPAGGDEGLTIGVVNVNQMSVKSGLIRNFHGVSNGLFAADNVSITGGGVPEPATWALMLVGVGAIGGIVRRRAKIAAA